MCPSFPKPAKPRTHPAACGIASYPAPPLTALPWRSIHAEVPVRCPGVGRPAARCPRRRLAEGCAQNCLAVTRWQEVVRPGKADEGGAGVGAPDLRLLRLRPGVGVLPKTASRLQHQR